MFCTETETQCKKMKEELFVPERYIKISVYFYVHPQKGTCHHFHIDHNAMHLVNLPKFCIAIVSNFSWVFHSRPKRNQRQWLCKIWGGKQGEISTISLMIEASLSSPHNHRSVIITLKASCFQNGSQIC